MVKVKFFDNIPVKKAIIVAITFGSSNSTNKPESLRKTAGKIIAGKTADGT